MEKRELIDGLGKIVEFFAARADMAIGDGKMLLLNWSKCAQEAATMLKAQEPVEPVAIPEDRWACGNCYSSVIGTEDLDASGFVPVKFNFCPNCGRAVKWK